MQMEAGLDTGPMLLIERLAIEAFDTTTTLTARLADCGARLIVEALRQAQQGQLVPVPQPVDDPAITYAHKLAKEEGQLDLRQPATVLARRVRAFDPYPVATLNWRDTALRLWRAEALATPHDAGPGTVLAADASGVQVQTGAGVLVLTELQRAGGKRLPAREFLAGTPITVGDRLLGAL